MATHLSGPLPDLTLEEKSVLVVDTGDAAVLITRLVIHFSQDVPELPQTFPAIPVLLAHEPAA